MGAAQQNLMQPGEIGNLAWRTRLLAETGAPLVVVAHAAIATSCRSDPVEVGFVEHITLIAELAGHRGDPLLAHIVELVG